MNGNFEFDRGAYPFTATRIGDAYKVLYTPDQVPLLDLKIPKEVAYNAALRTNTMYWAAKAGGKPFDGTSQAFKKILAEEAHAAYQRGDLDAVHLTQILNATKAD